MVLAYTMDTFGVIGGGTKDSYLARTDVGLVQARGCTSTQLCCRGLKVGAQRPPLSGMHEVSPPRERSTYWVSTATVETAATHILSINSADRIPWGIARARKPQ